ncbi:MAG TPA: hypothetical protein VKY90_15280, partial [Candidatus Dormibacteraeota bacterium]|nr:hypothetical protein [Candidatus Dormibacteraeota bacterium]
PPQTVSRPSCASPSVTPEGIGALDGTGVLGAPHRSSLRWGPLGGEPLKKGGPRWGMPRQGWGTAGEVERCRIGVLLEVPDGVL